MEKKNRQKISAIFEKFPDIINKIEIDFNSSFHLFPILIKNDKEMRNKFYSYLKNKGINTKGNVYSTL